MNSLTLRALFVSIELFTGSRWEGHQTVVLTAVSTGERAVGQTQTFPSKLLSNLNLLTHSIAIKHF